jgi:hypothetical protein
MRLTPIRHLYVDQPLSAGHAFLSSASGLVCLGRRYYVIADDEHHLAVFEKDTCLVGDLIPILHGALPQKAAARKKVKPDFEILVHLPAGGDGKNERLLALGSGSTDQRMRGAVISVFDADMSVEILDLRPLFAAIAPFVAEINLEGAIVHGDRLTLFNRGNMTLPITHVFETALSTVIGGGPVSISDVRQLALPLIDQVPLTVTDACRMDDGTIILSTVAEATADSYADGALTGAAVIVLDADYSILQVEPLEPAVKIEGIVARRAKTAIEILCVSDADNPDLPASLYRATIRE